MVKSCHSKILVFFFSEHVKEFLERVHPKAAQNCHITKKDLDKKSDRELNVQVKHVRMLIELKFIDISMFVNLIKKISSL